MKGELVYNAEKHLYTMNGEILPGVTTILGPLSDFSKVPADIMQRAKDFGHAAHDTIKYHHAGTLDEDALDPHLQGILRGFRAWLKGSGYQLSDFICEKPLGSKTLLYAGTPDLVLDGEAVIDIKTRLFKRLVDPLQCAGYEKLHVENGGSKGKYKHGVLYLQADGTYQYFNAYHPQAWGMFRTLLDHYRLGKTIEAWRNQK